MNLNTNLIKIGDHHYHQDRFGNLKPLKQTNVVGSPVYSTTTGSSQRGRKPKVTQNPYADIIRLALKLKMNWIDDYIIGAAFTSAGSSNSKPNVSPDDVASLLCCEEISAKNVGVSMYTFEISLRRQQLVAQAARFALNGVDYFFHKNPSMLEAMENLVLEHASSPWDEDFDLDIEPQQQL